MRQESNSAQLRARLALARPALDEATQAFWSHTSLATFYPKLLLVMYPVTRAVVPLMLTAARTARALKEDPLCTLLAEYLEHHAEEERGHEEWVLSDLALLGHTREEVMNRTPSTLSASLLGPQYFWVLHAHPVALLGYIACIEGTPPLLSELDEVQIRSGIPSEAFSTYRKHAQLDPDHKTDLEHLLDSLPLQPQHHALLGVSAIHTSNALKALFSDLLRQP